MQTPKAPICKKVGLFAIKYMPSILALTCSIKIMLLTSSDVQKDTYLFSVNWINWFLSLLTLAAFYALGKCFGYCWKHQSLCRVALWGYIFYAFFLIEQVPKAEVLSLTYLYVCVVVVYTILYKELK